MTSEGTFLIPTLNQRQFIGGFRFRLQAQRQLDFVPRKPCMSSTGRAPSALGGWADGNGAGSGPPPIARSGALVASNAVSANSDACTFAARPIAAASPTALPVRPSADGTAGRLGSSLTVAALCLRSSCGSDTAHPSVRTGQYWESRSAWRDTSRPIANGFIGPSALRATCQLDSAERPSDTIDLDAMT
jgi:hypothetical protein